MLGASTGAIAKDDFTHAIDIMNKIDALTAIEISFLKTTGEKLKSFIAGIKQLYLRKYKYISIHAPTTLPDFSEKQLAVILQVFAVNCWNIVIHPNLLTDFGMWKDFGKMLCVENMDSRKPPCQTAESMERFLENLPEASICLDIAHARQIDPTLIEILRITDTFGDRIKQVHISELNYEGRHTTISDSCANDYNYIAERIKHLPQIIESPVKNETELLNEIDIIQKIFDNKL